jgi:hypothetical protein
LKSAKSSAWSVVNGNALESSVRLGGLGESAVAAFAFPVAAVRLLVFANLDSSADVEVLEVLGFTALLVVGHLETASVGCGSVAHIAIGNYFGICSCDIGNNTDSTNNASKISGWGLDHGILQVRAIAVVANLAGGAYPDRFTSGAQVIILCNGVFLKFRSGGDDGFSGLGNVGG